MQKANLTSQPDMLVVQCWDDGLSSDIGLTAIFRRHGAKATFNICPGLHQHSRTLGWKHKGVVDVYRLGWDEMRDVYDGFLIANHSLNHPYLDSLCPGDARNEITEGRKRLQQYFAQSIDGFAYPFGAYNQAIMEMVREAGHRYARTTLEVEAVIPYKDAMALHPTCHFLAPDFWRRYEKARQCGVFYFWGHSYELGTPEMWQSFENSIGRISADPQARWADVADLIR